MKTPPKSYPKRYRYYLYGMVFGVMLGAVAQVLTDLATLQTHLDAAQQSQMRSIAGTVTMVLVLIYANFRFRRKTAQITKTFQDDGTIPPEGTASDTDVLRLVREGKVEAATGCYQSIHQVSLEQANLAIGIDSQKETHTLLLILFAIGAVLRVSHSLIKHDHIGFVIGAICAAGFFLVLLHKRQVHRKAEENRKMIEKGIVPSPKPARRPPKD